MSCDYTHDIMAHLLSSFDKYWKDNELDIFIGSNYNTIDPPKKNYFIVNSNKGNWKTESIEQINIIKNTNPNISHVILFLDDFILKKNVNTLRLNNVLNHVQSRDIKYLRLKKLEDSLLINFLNIFKKKLNIDNEKIFKIRKSHPYYSSLQVAIWDINYLLETIIKSENIWNFENRYNKETDHYSVSRNIFDYKHLVEKGNWEFYARNYCIKYIGYFNKGNRNLNTNSLKNKLKLIMKRIKFLIFGYIKEPNIRLFK